jgi:hypothetical protein
MNTKLKMKKTIVILLTVLFLVTVTVSSVSAAEHAGRKTVTLQSSILEQGKPILDLASLQVGPMGPTPYPSIAASAGRGQISYTEYKREDR